MTLPDNVAVLRVNWKEGGLFPEWLVIQFVKEEAIVRSPVGKGYFVWNLSRCAGGLFDTLAKQAKLAGLKWVAIKVANGIASFNGNITPWVEALHAEGIRVWGWQYVYGASPEGEAAVAIDALRKYNLDGFIINAEHEYKLPGRAPAARLYMDRLVSAFPDKGYGFCSYRYPSLHQALPWTEFLEKCTFHIPQVYWLGANLPTSAGSQLARSRTELLALRDMPIIPTGVACDHPVSGVVWRPTVEQVNNFNLTAKQLGLPGVAWWSWEHAEKIPSFWSAIAAHA